VGKSTFARCQNPFPALVDLVWLDRESLQLSGQVRRTDKQNTPAFLNLGDGNRVRAGVLGERVGELIKKFW